MGILLLHQEENKLNSAISESSMQHSEGEAGACPQPGTLLQSRPSRETHTRLQERVYGGCPSPDEGRQQGIGCRQPWHPQEENNQVNVPGCWLTQHAVPTALSTSTCCLENMYSLFSDAHANRVIANERSKSLLKTCGDPFFPNQFSTLGTEIRRGRDRGDR